MDWFKIGKGICQSCILLSCLFNLYTEYILRNARLDESQAGIKTARRWLPELLGPGKAQNAGPAQSVLLWSTRKLEPHATQGPFPIEQPGA